MIAASSLVRAVVRKDGATPCVELRGVLENHDGRLDRIKAGASTGENSMTGR